MKTLLIELKYYEFTILINKIEVFIYKCLASFNTFSFNSFLKSIRIF